MAPVMRIRQALGLFGVEGVCFVAVCFVFSLVGSVVLAGPAEGQRYPYAIFYQDANVHGVTFSWALNDRNVFAGGIGNHAGAFLPSGAKFDLGTLGGAESEAKRINNRNEVVGWAWEPGGTFVDNRPVLWKDGIIIKLPTLGGQRGTAYDINDAGVIVGESQIGPDLFDPQQPTLWENGVAINLGSLTEQKGGIAFGINDAGVIAGMSLNEGGGFRAVFWDSEGIHELPRLPGGSETAFDINNKGGIVGVSSFFGVDQAVIWIDGKPKAGYPDANFSESIASAINDHSVVVGNGKGDRRTWGVMWKLGSGSKRLDGLLAPNTPVIILSAADINNENQITGVAGFDGSQDDVRAYFMTPVDPELVLGEPVPGVAGVVNSFTVTGARPGAEVTFTYGMKGGGRFVPHCAVLDAVLQIDDAVVMGKGAADEDGVARIEMFVPDRARDEDILMMQCFDEGNCAESQLRVVRFE